MKIAAKLITAGLLVTSPLASFAKQPTPSGLELQQIQAKDFEQPKNIVFSAVMSVLQDAGYRILSADKDTGLITGIASTESHTTWVPFVGFGRKKLTPAVSAYVEDRSPTISRLRLNFVMTKYKSNSYGSDAGEKPITDPGVYRDAFEKIEKAIFVRVAMDAPSQPAAAAPVQPATPALAQAAVAASGSTVDTPSSTAATQSRKPAPGVTCVTCSN